MFGNTEWNHFYENISQQNLFGCSGKKRPSGSKQIVDLYKINLEKLFGRRFMKNSKNAPLFEFIFCVGSPSDAAIRLAKDIATRTIINSTEHLIDGK